MDGVGGVLKVRTCRWTAREIQPRTTFLDWFHPDRSKTAPTETFPHARSK